MTKKRDSFPPIPGESTDAPIERAISDLTASDFMEMPVALEKPFRESRYPVPQTEYESLKAESAERGMIALAEGIDSTDSSGAKIDAEPLEIPFIEIDDAQPEDGIPLVSAAVPASMAPVTIVSFNGINATGWTPPDCTMAIGPSHVLVSVNTGMACFTKTGVAVFNIPNLATFLGSAVPSGAKIFDPKLIYDHYAGRFVLVITAVRNAPQGSWFIVAASKTSNPTGSWTFYTLNALTVSAGSNAWADYPTVGFDSQAIYISSNQFSYGTNSFQTSRIRVLNKSQIYSAAAVTWVDYNNLTNNDGSQAFTIQPCTHFHGGGNSAVYFVNSYWPTSNGATKLTLWKLVNPLTSPNLTRVVITVNNFKIPPNAEQPGGFLTTGDIRLLNAMYQFSGGVQRVWTSHTVRVQWAGEAAPRSAVRWYEIDVNTNKVIQQQDFGAANLYYSYPAIHTDVYRNAFMVFTVAGPTTFAQMRQTGRRATDPANTMQGSALVKSGASAHLSGRWGDYFGIARDPSATNEVWGFAEFAAASGQWGTWVSKMKF
jgi:hypothetical protein